MIKIDTKQGMVDMTLNEFARWACLIEAYDFIEKKSEELDINPINLIKPLAIERYISERFDAMRYDIEVEYNMGNI